MTSAKKVSRKHGHTMRNKELRKLEISLIFRTLAFVWPFAYLKGKSNADEYSNGKATVTR